MALLTCLGKHYGHPGLHGDDRQCFRRGSAALRAAGMDDSLTKPVKVADLAAALQKWAIGSVDRS